MCVRRVMFVVWCACVCRVRSGGQGWTATAVEKASGETKVIKSVACDNIKAGNVALMEAKVLQVRVRREICIVHDVKYSTWCVIQVLAMCR